MLLASTPLETVHNTAVSTLVVSLVEVAAVPLYALLATELIISGWPISTSAAAALAVGMPFQIKMRL